MLEECGLSYSIRPVDIGKGEQFAPAFLKISPNHRIPAIVDQDGPDGRALPLFESGAILFYLAEKTGRFLPERGDQRYATMQWLMFQMSGVGPIFGQAFHFRNDAPEKIDYAINRFTNEARRLYDVMDRQLGETEYLAGDTYTIADIATWPWAHSIAKQGHDPKNYPNVVRWFETIRGRAAVQRGVKIFGDRGRTVMDEKAKDVLFGPAQYARR
jgi:GST-like protein